MSTPKYIKFYTRPDFTTDLVIEYTEGQYPTYREQYTQIIIFCRDKESGKPYVLAQLEPAYENNIIILNTLKKLCKDEVDKNDFNMKFNSKTDKWKEGFNIIKLNDRNKILGDGRADMELLAKNAMIQVNISTCNKFDPLKWIGK